MASNPCRLTLVEILAYGPPGLVAVNHLWDGRRLKDSEKARQSEEHRWMVIDSAHYFKANGFRVNRKCFGIQGLATASDYGMVKDGQFYFVECLSPWSPFGVIAKKRQLSRYAPVYFVIAADDKEKRQAFRGYPWLLTLDCSIHGCVRRRAMGIPGASAIKEAAQLSGCI